MLINLSKLNEKTENSTVTMFTAYIVNDVNYPDSMTTLGQLRPNNVVYVGPMLANFVGPMLFCSSALRWANV